LDHNLAADGYGFRLRPIKLDDAGFLTELRSDPSRTTYLHPVSSDPSYQHEWLTTYLGRAGDYYFVVERTSDLRREGTVGLYDVDGQSSSAEWGRWILQPGSVAAAASALLIYQIAFDVMGLGRVYCRTVADNASVVSFHDRCGLTRTGVLPGHFVLRGQRFDAVEHSAAFQDWPALRQLLGRRAAAAENFSAR
jgi:RimJ/RimL family protein N-acetyltransferase